ncbi:unnamed protein product [Cylicocyclus nassatus]|uniref:lysoplasmalogenase n=1 Tax=Cylicocyclus nassatus TaxID=53992 RepID=A0AA36GQM1_CYLNA|nr:unnamed protein product [Cylicocyclus nassatus]
MQTSTLYVAGAVYLLLVANFYKESGGFNRHYNAMYAVWKVIPIVFLVVFAAVNGGGVSQKNRATCALGLFFGAIGDVLLGLSKHGLVPGASAFGVGHLFYMSHFISRPLKIFRPLVYVTAAWTSVVAKMVFLPILEEHPIAVSILFIYSVLIALCLVMTASHYIHRNAGDEDKVLIMAHGGYRIPLAEMITLGTYYSAQYLILCGNIHSGLYVKQRYLTHASNYG